MKMPRKVMQKFVQSLIRDIASSYKKGDSYLTLKQLCKKFSVSYKVAQKGIQELVRLKMVKTVRNKGTTILSTEASRDLSKMKITVLCRGNWGNFNQSFFQGAREFGNQYDITTQLAFCPELDLDSTQLGEHLLQLDTNGIIGIGFPMGALGFCHAISRGLDIVVDIPLKELPYLPSVYTDNFSHSKRAGQRMKKLGIREVLLVTYHDVNGDFCRDFVKERYKGLVAGLEGSRARIIVAPLYEPSSSQIIDKFLERFNNRMAMFSINMDGNFMLASKCYQHHIKINPDNFFIYDDLNAPFSFYGLPPIPILAPSMKQLGAALAKKLVRKWETGKFEEPLWEAV
jgi:DNA-binding LacI/PurR family transcriptional regulator